MDLYAGEIISKKEIYSIISEFLYEVIDENIPYILYALEQPLSNIYNDKISCDCSGEVRKMNLKDLKQLKKMLKEVADSDMWSQTKLQELLSHINIDKWETTFTPNCRKHWLTYEDLLEEKFIGWKNKKFDLYNLFRAEDYEELDVILDESYDDFFKDISDELYYYKILKKLENTIQNS